MVLFNKLLPKVPNIVANEVKLERLDCVTLLGLKITSNLTWVKHVDHIVKRGQQRLFCLNMLRRSIAAPKYTVQIYW